MAKHNSTGSSIRCAIYTRKSTDEGLDSDFNTLDAQRLAGENFIASQQGEGWVCIPDLYDDGGFTGSNIERPALRRLMEDIKAGLVDCVVVYKVDRLSRSLLDFARLMEVFDSQNVSFVSVTQQFNTTSSMGRLTLNILLSFAQFEREIISERTSDKIAATRRKGKWSGGHPLLGYDIAPEGGKLVVNEDEAEQVRKLFETYLECHSLIETVKVADKHGWRNKRWVTKKGKNSGGKPFTKTSLYKLFKNVTYLGKLTYKTEVHEGEHPAIVDAEIFSRTQRLLASKGGDGGKWCRNRFGAILKGLIRCVPCESAMSPSHTTRGNKRYRYYICQNAQKRGWHNCPSKAVPAQEIEKFVVDQIRCIGQDEKLLGETISQLREKWQERKKELEAEKGILARELKRHNDGLRELVTENSDAATARMADLQDRIRKTEKRATEVREELILLGREILDEKEAAKALALFDPVWETLAPREQARIVRLLIKRVDYDGEKGTVQVVFHPHGIKRLTEELKEPSHE